MYFGLSFNIFKLPFTADIQYTAPPQADANNLTTEDGANLTTEGGTTLTEEG